jgi:hypothetical protein
MAIYELNSNEIRRINETNFCDEGITERGNLQRLLRKQIDIIAHETLVISEEFSEWSDSRRRIDLLAIDRDANLVVIELKRSEDGGNMDLQAVRYAAMVSTLTFDKVVDIYGRYLLQIGESVDPKTSLLDFLGWETYDENEFARDVRIVLASAEFSKELTTTVMWLNERGIDIRCVRMQPYKDGDRLLLDIQQVIPLPEAAEYQVQLREKEQRGRQERAERFGIRHKFWEQLLSTASKRTQLHSNISPGEYHWIGAASGTRGLAFNYVVRKDDATVELYIDRGTEKEDINKQIFDWFYLKKDAIEQQFGSPLSWQRLDEKRGWRIASNTTLGGYRSEESNWPVIHDEMIDHMIRLEAALRPYLQVCKSEIPALASI